MDNRGNSKSSPELVAFIAVWTIVLLICVIFLAVMESSFADDTDAATVTTFNTISETEVPDIELEEAETVEITEPVAETVPEPTENIHIEETELPSEALSAPVSDETVPEVDKEALELLACVIYQEAGGNRCCDECRRRVADIVLNRVESEHFPDTIEGVLTEKSQYGLFHWTGVVWPEKAKYESEQEAVNRAYEIAEEVLLGEHSELYDEGYIWQAEFKQGRDGFWCCGTYFGR